MPIQPLTLDTSLVANAKLAPHIMRPMIDAARAGRDLVPVVTQLVQSMGFDNFVYALSISPRPNREAHLYAFTTLPLRWMQAYDASAFVEVDPRIGLILGMSVSPVAGTAVGGLVALLATFLGLRPTSTKGGEKEEKATLLMN